VDTRYYLNMFKTTTPKGAETRKQIFDVAMGLFRKRGFHETTMRDIATEAGLALGAAYYYFPSKEAIVASYYDFVQAEHRERSRALLASVKDLKARLNGVIQAKLDILGEDRQLLAALFRYGGDPGHPLSWFGPETRPHRESCMRTYAEAMAVEKMPEDVREIAPLALWALDMGILLYLLYDKSEGQARTRRLAKAAMEFVVQARKLVGFPLLRPIRKRVMGILREAGLVPEMTAVLTSE